VNALASLRVDALLSYAIAIIIPALDAMVSSAKLRSAHTAKTTVGQKRAIP
jgi:hypothetical protein